MLKEVFESSRKFMNRTGCTFDLLLLSPLGDASKHNLAAPTILDSVTEGKNAWLLI